MLVLNVAIESIQRALQCLETAGPGEPPARDSWLQARIHLTSARMEIGRIIEWTHVPAPSPANPSQPAGSPSES